MNSNIASRAIKGLSLSLLVGGLVGCSVTDPSADLEVRITMPSTGVVLGGQILDGNGRIVTSPVKVTIGGPDASAIVDLLNENLTTITTTSGFLVMAVNDTILPDSANPVEFTVTATAAGYFPAVKNFSLTRAEEVSFQLRLISTDPAQLPAGLVGDRETANVPASGELPAPVTVASPANASNGSSTSVSIPSGARFFDVNGNRLTGNIVFSLVFGDLRSDTLGLADKYFPGGRENLQTGDSSSAYPFSFISLMISDASGRIAARIDAPISFTTQVPGGTLNPGSARAIAAGDTITIFSGGNGGTWTGLLQGVVSGPNGNGNFTATFDIEANALIPGLGKGVSQISGSDDEWDYDMGGMFGFDEPYTPSTTLYFSWRGAAGHQFQIKYLCDQFDPRESIKTITFKPLAEQGDDYDWDWRNQEDYERSFEFNMTTNSRTSLVAFWIISGDSTAGPYWMGHLQTTVDFGDGAWPWPTTKNVNCHIYAKMPEGRDPSEIRSSGLYIQVADAADTSSWRPVGSVQRGEIMISDLNIGHSYYLKGTYTFRGQTRTANTPWTRLVTAQTDTLEYWYQLSEDEADDYNRGG